MDEQRRGRTGRYMGKRILVADDSVTIQRAFAMVLGVEDVSLIAARSWDEALSAARQQKPDLVFLDINLRERSGYDLCATLKGDRAFSDVPVIILASAQVPYDAERGEKARADGHFIKPFESNKLLEFIATASAANRDAAPARPSSAPVAVPVEDTSRVSVDGNFDDEDSYGEFTIEPTGGGSAPASSPGAARPMPAAPPRPTAVVPPRPAVMPPAARPPSAAPPARPAMPPSPSVSAPVRPAVPSAPLARPAPAPMAASPTGPTSPKAPPRPSLIPGVMPPRAADAPVLARPASAPPPSAPMDFGRTMMGMPAAPPPASERASPRPASALSASLFEGVDLPPAAPAPQAPLMDMPTPIGGRAKDGAGLLQDRVASRPEPPAPSAPAPSEKLADKVSDRVGQKLAEISARGPEYEAIAKLSREIIEQVVWEVVPELAEVMIREQIERLAKR